MIPKPAHDERVRVAQTNAVTALTGLGANTEVIVFGAPDDVGSPPDGVRYCTDMQTSPAGAPLLDSVFANAQALARNPLCCYLNADIVLTNDILTAAQRVRHFSQFILVGERCDVDLVDEIDVSGGDEALRKLASTEGALHGPAGIDYFLFPRGLFVDLPAFRVGRPAWDNWLLHHARSRGIPIVDATRVVLALHQNHDYSHLTGGHEEARTGEDAQANKQLADADARLTILDATHVLTRRFLTPALSLARLERRVIMRSASRRSRTSLNRLMTRLVVKALRVLQQARPAP